MDDDSGVLSWIVAIIIVIGFLVVASTGGCDANPQDVTRILTQDGITNIKLGGYGWFDCGRDDYFSSTFTGVKNGQPVSGVVCKGGLKDYTIRYD